MSEPLTKDEAVAFFAHFFGGMHHIPPMKQCGRGWNVHVHDGLSTYDFDGLSRLVFMAHDYGYRVDVAPAMRYLRISIWRRAREGSISRRHPTLEQATEKWRQGNQIQQDQEGGNA